jgi:hypothetical protein
MLFMLKRRSQHLRIQNELASKLLGASSAINASKAARSTYRYLWDAEVRVFSQWGEDGILEYLFDLVGLHKPKIVEFGAGNFSECNSRFAAEYRNASVYAVDMREDLVQEVQSLDIYWRNSIYPVCDFITSDSAKMHQRLAEQKLGGIDCISIDIDGNDYWVLQSLNLSNVQVVVCEYNPLYGSNLACTVEKKDFFDRTKEHFSWLHYGMSLRAAIDLLSLSDFIFVGSNRAGNNAFFIKKNYVDLLSFDLPDIRHLKDFVDWRVRESRDEHGNLSYLTKEEAISIISDCRLVNLATLESAQVKQLIN